MNKLTQIHLGKKRIYTIEDKGLRFQRHEGGRFIDEIIKWENIGFDEIISGYLPTKYELLFFGSILLNLLGLTIPFTLDGNPKVSGAVIGIFTAVTALTSKKIFSKKYEKIITGVYSVRFFYFDKNKKEVDEFIKLVKQNKSNYFTTKYLNNVDFDSIDEYQIRLKWLREEDLISEDEFNNLNKKKIKTIQGFSV